MTVITRIKLFGFFTARISIAIASLAAAASDELVQRSANGVSFSAILVEHPVTLKKMEAIFRDRLPALTQIAVIQAFPTTEIAHKILVGKGHTDTDRSQWFKEYRSFEKTPIEMAEIVKVDGDVLLRVVRGNKVEEKILSGNNPLACSTSISGCRVIWVSIGQIPPLLRGKIDQMIIHLFVELQILPNSVEALAISKRLQQRFRSDLVTVSFRSDTWFISDTEFPVIFPFKTSRDSVLPQQLRESDEVVCASLGGGLRCR